MQDNIVEAKTWRVPLTGWMTVLFFLVCTVFVIIYKQWLGLVFFVPFILLGLPFIFMAHKIRMDKNGVRVKTLQGQYALNWEEVSAVTYGRSNMVFWAGEQKRLIAPAPRWWTRGSREKVLQSIVSLLEEKQIPSEKNPKSDFLFFKQTKV
jgi:hypothetical protein